MARIFPQFLLVAMGASVAVASVMPSSWAAPADPLQFKLLNTHETGSFDEGAAEITAFMEATNRLYIVNAEAVSLDVLSLADPAVPTVLPSISLGAYGASLNSVAVHGGKVAVVIAAEDVTKPGKVILLDAEGRAHGEAIVGANPDMVTFTPDGSHLIVANEGEPSDDYETDPEGTVSIVRVSDLSVRTADFSRITALPEGMRVGKPGASIQQDLEPEYVAVSADGKTAYVTLQENNGIAVIDIDTANVTGLLGLGYKDHMVHPLDASNKDGGLNIRTWPVKGMYQPDAIAAYEVDGQTYLVTANEGDARDYGGWSEEATVADLTLDETAFPNADELQAEGALGRLKTSTTMGDTDGDGDHDEIYAYGARSFSIWSTRGDLIFDSGAEMERLTARRLGTHFNSNNDENESGDKRSDDKGPEPEGVVVGEINGRKIAFIGLERVGGVMAYVVTQPAEAKFLGYHNNRDFDGSASAGRARDLGPEGLTFVPAAASPNGRDLLIVANEVSGTTSIFEITLSQ